MRISDWSSDVCSSDLGADVIAFVVDGKGGVGPKVTAIAEALAQRREPKYLILNKVDIADKARLLAHVERLHAITPFAETFFVSAATGDGVADLKTALATAMPEGPWHFPEDQVSDVTESMLAAEVTREQQTGRPSCRERLGQSV